MRKSILVTLDGPEAEINKTCFASSQAIEDGSVKIVNIRDYDPYWESYRRETAKDILAGFAAKIGHPIDDYSEQSCKYAISLADELIKQLKGEEK